MVKRVIVKKGYIYKVELEDGTIRYFQYIGEDKSNLNADVICVFKKHYTESDEDGLSVDTIVNDDIEFYTHTSVSAGVKLGLWSRVFTNSPVIHENNIFFRRSLDILKTRPNQPPIVSYRWYVWEMNGKERFVGWLRKKYHQYDVGGVYSPYSVVKYLKTGERETVYDLIK